MPASPETIQRMEERKLKFLDNLRNLGEWEPAQARQQTGITSFDVTAWLNKDNAFREQYFGIKQSWTNDITERAVKSVATSMFEKGKEWLLVQWLKVHDPDWRNAARAQINAFTQINMLSQVRNGNKPVLVQNEVTSLRSGDGLVLTGADRSAMMGAMTTERNQAR